MLLNPSAKISMEKEVEKIRFSEIGGSPELIKILSDHLKSRDVSFNFLESAEGLETMEMVEQMLIIRDNAQSLYYDRLKERMYSNLTKLSARKYLHEFKTTLDEFDDERRRKQN